MQVEFQAVCGPKFMTLSDDVGDTGLLDGEDRILLRSLDTIPECDEQTDGQTDGYVRCDDDDDDDDDRSDM